MSRDSKTGGERRGGLKEQLVKKETTCREDFWPTRPGGLIKGGMSEAKLAAVAVSWRGNEQVKRERRSCCSNAAGASRSHVNVFQQLGK